ncbi:Endonuclease/exonuclease/phosphatase [Chytridium lagenaria]|nr:Endonuclease/exonuclease/phosphatase [Chytridium lagenaria]
MRLLSWNVNESQTDLNSCEELFRLLHADIFCFQEFKLNRARVDSQIALVPGFDAFFAFNKNRAGYSGVTTYTRTGPTTPHDSEDCFSSRSTDIFLDIFSEKELQALDTEGRVVVTDHKLFVLLNPYSTRYRFHLAIGHKVAILVASGREVMVVGDFNVCHREIDHCDPGKCILKNIDKFEDTPSRRWMDTFLLPQGNMVDLFRYFHPERRGAFTCWNTLIDARKSNYGTRIDYITCTAGLLPWMKSCDIDASIMGSDPLGSQTSLKRWVSSGSEALASQNEDAANVSRSMTQRFLLQRQIFFAQPKESRQDKDPSKPWIPDILRAAPQSDSVRQEEEIGTQSTDSSSLEWPQSNASMSSKAAAAAWKTLLVNKPGPNNGRFFFLCARPVGPSDGKNVDGTEAGDGIVKLKKGQKLTEFRCDFFLWKKGGSKRKGDDV